MGTPSSTRRCFLKHAGLTAGLVGSGILGASTSSATTGDLANNRVATRATMRQLMATEVLVVGGGPAGREASGKFEVPAEHKGALAAPFGLDYRFVKRLSPRCVS